MKKVIVIGLDGLEPKIVEVMFRSGELPNLLKLREQGGYSRVLTTYPAQTPVAWSTFATGTNPGGHGIFDFLSRDPKTYLPILGLNSYEQKNPFVPPKVINLRRGTPFWELLSKAGIVSMVIRCPCTYPPDNIKGRMISGVGVPDLRGGLGTSAFFTTQKGVRAEHNEKVIEVSRDSEQNIRSFLIGPRNPKTKEDITFDLNIKINPREGSILIRSEGQPNELQVKVGEWSDWLKVKFKAGMLQSIRGIVRFYLRGIEPDFELYASPVNFDPASPMFPITSPIDYAAEIEARIGTYYTSGMPEDHDGLINGRFDEEAYLEQCGLVMRERVRMMIYELKRFEEGFFFCLFDTPDRLQHMFWRFRDLNHPANQNGFSTKLTRVIEDHYRELDGIVGRVLKYVDDQTLFIVLSDHGMNSFQRGLNLNTWLYENGYLALKNGVKPGEAGDDVFFHNVDWNRTKAYSLGLGMIYLNLQGREERGIVSENDIQGVKESIIKNLTGLVDPELGKVAVRSVVTREQVYSGPYINDAPDLIVNFSEGYRVSWGTPLGGVPKGLFEDNVKRWGGDHVIDPILVPGVFFMNKPWTKENVSLVDMAPTILNAFGLPKGSAMEGESLL